MGKTLWLVYDKACPLCEAYCQRLGPLKGAKLERIDARLGGALLEEVTRAGMDIDQGMVLKEGGRLYYGADAIHRLATLSPRRGLIHRLSRLLFGTPARAQFFYPGFRWGRNLLLKLLRRTKINNLEIAGNDRF